jgi:hypothetical protein
MPRLPLAENALDSARIRCGQSAGTADTAVRVVNGGFGFAMTQHSWRTCSASAQVTDVSAGMHADVCTGDGEITTTGAEGAFGDSASCSPPPAWWPSSTHPVGSSTTTRRSSPGSWLACHGARSRRRAAAPGRRAEPERGALVPGSMEGDLRGVGAKRVVTLPGRNGPAVSDIAVTPPGPC